MQPTSTLFSETPIGVNVMRSLLLSAAMVALIAPTAMAQSTDGADAPIMEAPGRYLVFFPWNKAALTADDQRVVAQAAEEFRTTGSARINVTGFTDTSGSPAYNLRLSERRAQMVAAELERLGVPAADLVGDRPRSGGSAGPDRRQCPRGRQPPGRDRLRRAGSPAPVPEVAAKEEPPHPSEAVPRLGLELAALYGHNFGEQDDSGSNGERENDLAGVELSFNALPGDIASLTLKQAILYSFNGEDDGLNGRTGLGLGLTPLNLGLVHPFLQANLGYIYGPGVQDGVVAGPELGFDIELSRATVLNAKVAWDHQFRNADFDRGILWAGRRPGIPVLGAEAREHPRPTPLP